MIIRVIIDRVQIKKACNVVIDRGVIVIVDGVLEAKVLIVLYKIDRLLMLFALGFFFY
jgi:hypothetical protein